VADDNSVPAPGNPRRMGALGSHMLRGRECHKRSNLHESFLFRSRKSSTKRKSHQTFSQRALLSPPGCGMKIHVGYCRFNVLFFLALITWSGNSVPAVAGSIIVPGIHGLILKALPDFVAIGGQSTDGADFADSDTDPIGLFIGVATGVVNGTAGTSSTAAATATRFPFTLISTSASTTAGKDQASSAFAIAKAGNTISAQIAIGIGAFFKVQIDPFLINQGNAAASMSYALIFNGQTLFTAGASLNDGILSTSGAFSPSDFQIIHAADGSTMAVLTQVDFSVPFEIPANLLNTDLSLEFDQRFDVSSTNGGLATVSSAPEPSMGALVGCGFMTLMGWRLLHRRQVTVISKRAVLCRRDSRM
jgi:hypothetical protein